MVWALYLQTLLWITPIVCPFLTILSPLILYVLFHYTVFSLDTFYYVISEGAQSSDGDTSYLIFIFANLIFLGLVNTSYGYYIIESIKHTCGAFATKPVSPQSIMDQIYTKTTLISG